MAHLGKYISKKTGKITWRVTFRKRIYEKDRRVKKDLHHFCSFSSQEEAEKYIEDNEHVFFLQEPGETAYDRLVEKRQLRFRHKIKEKD